MLSILKIFKRSVLLLVIANFIGCKVNSNEKTFLVPILIDKIERKEFCRNRTNDTTYSEYKILYSGKLQDTLINTDSCTTFYSDKSNQNFSEMGKYFKQLIVFPKAPGFLIYIDTSQYLATQEFYDFASCDSGYVSYPVFLQNISTDTVFMGSNYLPLALEYNEKDIWIPIEKVLKRRCGNCADDIQQFFLKPNEICLTYVNKLAGLNRRKFRLRYTAHFMKYNKSKAFSNEFYINADW